MIFVLVARIGRLEAVGAGLDLEHVADDVGQRRLVDARALVDAVAGVEPHLLGRNALERHVDRRDVKLGARGALPVVEPWIDEAVGQERIVDLKQ